MNAFYELNTALGETVRQEQIVNTSFCQIVSCPRLIRLIAGKARLASPSAKLPFLMESNGLFFELLPSFLANWCALLFFEPESASVSRQGDYIRERRTWGIIRGKGWRSRLFLIYILWIEPGLGSWVIRPDGWKWNVTVWTNSFLVRLGFTFFASLYAWTVNYL